jgi:predicted RNase H-like nuclease (RuvC/YqgF family)
MSAEIVGTFVTNYLIPVIIALTGFLMAIGKLRVLKPKEPPPTNMHKSHTEIIKEMPIFYDREMQRAQDEIQRLEEKVQSLQLKMERLEGALNTLRAELRRDRE